MWNGVFVGFARMFMSLRECVVVDRTQEISEQAVCDLNLCLDQLGERCSGLDARIEVCTKAAHTNAMLSQREPSRVHRERSLEKAKQYLSERRRLRVEHDRATRSMAMLQRQISTILNSHVDSAIIGAMRQYTMAASRLGLPDRTEEVRSLTDELSECMEDSNRLQDALGGVSNACNMSATMGVNGVEMTAEEEALDLQNELDDFLGVPKAAVAVPDAVVSQEVVAGGGGGGGVVVVVEEEEGGASKDEPYYAQQLIFDAVEEVQPTALGVERRDESGGMLLCE